MLRLLLPAAFSVLALSGAARAGEELHEEGGRAAEQPEQRERPRAETRLLRHGLLLLFLMRSERRHLRIG